MMNKIENDKIVLWGVSISPYVRKVMVALAEKKLHYTLNEILPISLLKATGQNVPKEFELTSPLGKIPAIQIGSNGISDSAVIAKYLESKFATGNRLYPKIPEAYAESIWFEQYSDTVLTDVCYKKIFLEGVIKPNVLNIDADLTIINNAIDNELPCLLRFLDSRLSDRQYFSGVEFSMADSAITTQLLALQMYGVTIERQYKNLKNHFERALSRQSFMNLLNHSSGEHHEK